MEYLLELSTDEIPEKIRQIQDYTRLLYQAQEEGKRDVIFLEDHQKLNTCKDHHCSKGTDDSCDVIKDIVLTHVCQPL